MKRSSLFALAVVATSVLFAVSGRLHMTALESPPIGTLPTQIGMNGETLSSTDGMGTWNLPGPGHGAASVDPQFTDLIRTSDGGYITWYQFLNNTTQLNNIVVQKFSSDGAPLWGDGVIANADWQPSFASNNIDMVTDGADGIFLAWTDNSPYVHVQRINSSGSTVFPSPVTTVTSGSCVGRLDTIVGQYAFFDSYSYPSSKAIISDGANGVIVLWNVNLGEEQPVCLQRLAADGSRLWTNEGVNAGGHPGYFWYLVPDTVGGAFVGITDGTLIIHAAADGSLAAGCQTDLGGGQFINFASDGVGGFIVIRTDDAYDAVADRFNADCSHNGGWPAGGVVVTASNNPEHHQFTPQIFNDKLMLSWRGPDPGNTFANLLNISNGTSVWGGEKTVASAYTDGANYSWAQAVPSGTDFLFASIKSQDGTNPNNGAVLSKLNGATGEPVVAFGGTHDALTTDGYYPMDASSDGAGGIVFVYTVNGQDGIFAQRYDGNGSGPAPHGTVSILSDQQDLIYSEDGGYITWYNMNDSSGNPQIAVQKINSSGNAVWGDGVIVNHSWLPRVHAIVQITTDGAGGVFIVWADGLVSAAEDATLDGGAYVQRVNSAGEKVFPAPVALDLSEQCGQPNWDMDWQGHWSWFGPGSYNFTGSYPYNKQIVADGEGGVIAMWMVTFYGPYYCSQKVNAAGARVWGDNGVSFSRAGWPTLITSDGAGGAFIGDGIFDNILDHVNAGGGLVAGCQVNVGPNGMIDLTYDGAGNVIALFKAFDGATVVADSFGQDCSHNPAWPIGGVTVATNMKVWYDNIFSRLTGDGNMVMTWLTEDQTNVYANLISIADGSLPWGAPQDEASDAYTYNWGYPVVVNSDYVLFQSPTTNEPTPFDVLTFRDFLHGQDNSNTDMLTLVSLAFVSDGGTGYVALYQDPSDGNRLHALRRHIENMGDHSEIVTDWMSSAFYSPPNTPPPPLIGLWPDLNALLTPSTPRPQHSFAIDTSVNRSVFAVAAPNGNKAVFWTTADTYSDNSAPQTYVTYMKLLDANGGPSGSNDGMQIVDQSTGIGGNFRSRFVDAVTDDSGFYVAFAHSTDAESYVAVQKYDLAGTAEWPAGGVRVLPGGLFGIDDLSRLAADGAGGVYVSSYNGGAGRLDVFRLNRNGQFVWDADGVAVGTSVFGGSPAGLLADQAGVYVAWTVSGLPAEAYLVRLNAADGVTLPGWNGTDGVTVGTFAADIYISGLIMADGNSVYVAMTNLEILDELHNSHSVSMFSVNKVGSDGVVHWGNRGLYLGSAVYSKRIDYSIVPDDEGGFFANWIDNVGSQGGWDTKAQHVDQNGEKSWGTTAEATTTADTHSGDTTIAATSLDAFEGIGSFTMNGVSVYCDGRDSNNFHGCIGVPDASAGTTIAQNSGSVYEHNICTIYAMRMVPDGHGGAVAVQSELCVPGNPAPTLTVDYIDANGNVLYGGPNNLSDGNSWAIGSFNSHEISLIRDESDPSRPSIFGVWLAQNLTDPDQNFRVIGQQFRLARIPSSPAGGAPSGAPTLTVPAGGSSSIVAGPTQATYYFSNSGNATSFKLVKVKPDGTTGTIATVDDPIATSITETGLTPNTEYGGRMVVPVNDKGEGAASLIYPTFTTPENQPTAAVASLDANKTTFTVTALGEFPNLTAGRSGIVFTIKGTDKDGTTSGWLQSPNWTVPGLVVGKTYDIEVQTKNSAGETTPAVTFSVIPAPTSDPHIVLTKVVDVFKATLQTPTAEEPKPVFPTTGPYLKEGEPPVYTVPGKNINMNPEGASYDISRLQGALADILVKPTLSQPILIDFKKDRAVLRYRITARNDGLAAAYNTVITDRIPSSIIYQPESVIIDQTLGTDAVDSDPVAYNSTTSTLTVKIPEFKPGESRSFTFDTIITARPLTDVKNKATATYSDIMPVE